MQKYHNNFWGINKKILMKLEVVGLIKIRMRARILIIPPKQPTDQQDHIWAMTVKKIV